MEDITKMPHLGILLCCKKKKRKGELLLLRQSHQRAWILSAQLASRSSQGEQSWQCKMPREQGCKLSESRLRRKKNQVSGKNGLGKWGSKTAGMGELP